MPNAQLGNYTFNIDPSSASWGYTLNVSRKETYGGWVLQILSRHIDDLIISGYIPNRGNRQIQFAEMEQFEIDMRSIMEQQAQDPPRSVRFSYPEIGWEGNVFLMGYESVTYDVQTNAAKYTLHFTVDSGFGSVNIVDAIEGIDNIPDGVNWVRNRYNTPSQSYKYEDIMEAIGKILDDIGTFDSLEDVSLYVYLDKLDKEKKEEETKQNIAELATKTAAMASKIQQTATGSSSLLIGAGFAAAANALEELYQNG